MQRIRMIQPRLWALVAVIAVILLAGCTTTTPPEFTLTGIEWQWQNWTVAGEGTTEVPNPENYTLLFNADGTLSGRADCNNFAGTYTQNNGGIQIALGPMTAAACGEDSLDTVYLNALGQIVAGGPDGSGNLALENGGGETRMIFSSSESASAATSCIEIFTIPIGCGS